jgi:hypothetical protein
MAKNNLALPAIIGSLLGVLAITGGSVGLALGGIAMVGGYAAGYAIGRAWRQNTKRRSNCGSCSTKFNSSHYFPEQNIIHTLPINYHPNNDLSESLVIHDDSHPQLRTFLSEYGHDHDFGQNNSRRNSHNSRMRINEYGEIYEN